MGQTEKEKNLGGGNRGAQKAKISFGPLLKGAEFLAKSGKNVEAEIEPPCPASRFSGFGGEPNPVNTEELGFRVGPEFLVWNLIFDLKIPILISG